MRAHQIMTRDVITVGPRASVVDAATIMLRGGVSGLPVVDEQNRLVGVISEGDFLRRSEIGTGHKRPRLLEVLAGPVRLARDFVQVRTGMRSFASSGRPLDDAAGAAPND